ncbi:hypothetical protein [Serratia marcescens]|uniref:hypothetical protein n=3 Tax=Serratia marcescens TaxID=615 RepID=UPI0011E8E2D8|nr:hypothetical protein [Serratia marcescens]TYR87642.1 hypothetical protein FYK38_17940 [Serratia marcescens]
MRNGTKQMSGGCVSHVLMPYGMREIHGFGDNVWEFFNRQYDVIGLPFRLAKRPTDEALAAVSWDKNECELRRDYNYGRIVFFAQDALLHDEVMNRVFMVMEWKLHPNDGELRDLPATKYPHTFCDWSAQEVP